MKVSATNGKRYAMFHNKGLNLCWMNGDYDDENSNQVKTKGDYWEIYDNYSEIVDNVNTRKVFINLGVEDLKAEYNRIKEFGKWRHRNNDFEYIGCLSYHNAVLFSFLLY